MAVGTVALVMAAHGPSRIAASVIYGVSAVFLFGASALYHAQKVEEGGTSIWRKLDHLAIFFMIAGSYTPICWVYLQGGWRWSILGVQWGMALLGTVFKLFVIRTPRYVTVGIYLIMGWVVVIPMHRLYCTMDPATLGLFVWGGVAYTVGAVTYATKRPDPQPGVFGFHEIWHLWVLVAAFLHLAAIYRTVSHTSLVP